MKKTIIIILCSIITLQITARDVISSSRTTYAIGKKRTPTTSVIKINTLSKVNTYSGAYPPTNSGRIRSAWAAIKSVIPADMHPFWEEKRKKKGRKEFYPFDLLIFKVDVYPIPEHMHPVWIQMTNKISRVITIPKLQGVGVRIPEHMHPLWFRVDWL